MIRQALTPLAAACVLAIASQASAAPSPYSTMVVFGDSLSDSGQFPDPGGPAGASTRFTNRVGPIYLDGSGEVFGPTAPMILGASWASLRPISIRRPPWSVAPRMATTGRWGLPHRRDLRLDHRAGRFGGQRWRQYPYSRRLSGGAPRRSECALLPHRWRQRFPPGQDLQRRYCRCCGRAPGE